MLVTPFGRSIKRLRIEAGLTVRDLAAAVGKSAAYIAKIVVRGVIPNAHLVREIAIALGANSTELLDLAKEVRIANAARDVDRRYANALTTTSAIGDEALNLSGRGTGKMAPIVS